LSKAIQGQYPDRIKRVYEKYKNEWDIKYTVQEGKGKGDAVRKGFAMAGGETLVVLGWGPDRSPEDLSNSIMPLPQAKENTLTAPGWSIPWKSRPCTC